MTSFCDIYVFDAPTNHPAPLYQQCFQYILMNLKQFPIASLALLPLKTRWNLLWNLSLADVCQLEITQFTSGMCMEKYWQTIVHTDVAELGDHSERIDCMLKNVHVLNFDNKIMHCNLQLTEMECDCLILCDTVESFLHIHTCTRCF